MIVNIKTYIYYRENCSFLQKLGIKEAIKSCRTLFIVLIMMIICWTPYTVVILIDFKDLQSMEVSNIDRNADKCLQILFEILFLFEFYYQDHFC